MLCLAFTAVLSTAACALWFETADRNAWTGVLVLAVCALLAQWVQQMVTAEVQVSLASILIGAAIALAGPLGGAVVGFVAQWVPTRSHSPIAWFFNVSQTVLIGAFGGLAFLACGGWTSRATDATPMELVVRQLLPLGVATVVMLLVNTTSVSIMIRVSGGERLNVAVTRLVRRVGRTYLGYGIVSFLIAVLWRPVGLGPATVLVMLAPLVLAQWSYAQQHAESVAHERTVAGLVAAVEARDPTMAGRSQQIADVSALIGNQLRLSPKQADALHFAALLHDVGMVAPLRARRDDSAQLLAQDLERIRRHPQRGVEMLKSIRFLDDAVKAVLHHHERWDGRGYPDRMSGAQIPRLACILAVADAFCAVAAADPVRGADGALEVLQQRAGSQFDPACVEALSSVLPAAAAIVTAAEPPEPGNDRRPTTLDHDLPHISDLLAQEAQART